MSDSGNCHRSRLHPKPHSDTSSERPEQYKRMSLVNALSRVGLGNSAKSDERGVGFGRPPWLTRLPPSALESCCHSRLARRLFGCHSLNANMASGSRSMGYHSAGEAPAQLPCTPSNEPGPQTLIPAMLKSSLAGSGW